MKEKYSINSINNIYKNKYSDALNKFKKFTEVKILPKSPISTKEKNDFNTNIIENNEEIDNSANTSLKRSENFQNIYSMVEIDDVLSTLEQSEYHTKEDIFNQNQENCGLKYFPIEYDVHGNLIFPSLKTRKSTEKKISQIQPFDFKRPQEQNVIYTSPLKQNKNVKLSNKKAMDDVIKKSSGNSRGIYNFLTNLFCFNSKIYRKTRKSKKFHKAILIRKTKNG